MNNKPVAYVDNVWINRPDLAMDLGIGQMFSRCQLSDHQIPLYTHPVNPYQSITNTKIEPTVVSYTHPVKELTDAEIRTIQDMCHLKNVGYNNFIMRFARAILRQAKEK